MIHVQLSFHDIFHNLKSISILNSNGKRSFVFVNLFFLLVHGQCFYFKLFVELFIVKSLYYKNLIISLF